MNGKPGALQRGHHPQQIGGRTFTRAPGALTAPCCCRSRPSRLLGHCAAAGAGVGLQGRACCAEQCAGGLLEPSTGAPAPSGCYSQLPVQAGNSASPPAALSAPPPLPAGATAPMAPLLAAQPCRAASHSTASCSGRPPAAPGTPARLAPPGRQRRRTCRRAPLLTCASAADGGGSSKPHPEEGEPVGGDGALQDSLVQRLQFEIGKKRVRLGARGGGRWPRAVHVCCCVGLPAAVKRLLARSSKPGATPPLTEL